MSEKLGIKGFQDSKRYEEVRPGYPKEAVKLLMTKIGVLKENGEPFVDKKFNILELGAGTGKFTRVMAEVLKDANVHIIASDPVKGMCDQFREVLPDIEVKQFSAENIELPDESIDVVVSANAFHWIAERKQSLLEISRVLTPRGMLGLIWCFPDCQSHSWVQGLWEYLDPLFLRECTFGVFPFYEEKILAVIPMSGKFGKLERYSLKTSLHYNSASFFQFVNSFSVVQAATSKERSDLEELYRELMKKREVETGKELSSVQFVSPIYWCQKM